MKLIHTLTNLAETEREDPCGANICGPYSQSSVHGSRCACSCQPGTIGSPPACRPECVLHPDCPSSQACVQSKCSDPCERACGQNARCKPINHRPVCTCFEGFQGDPVVACYPKPSK